MKRMKRVFQNSAEVIHLWANQSQSEARCKNAFYNGTRLYSYGQHYLLANLIQFNGKSVALINANGYSKTTSDQIHTTWHATKHLVRLKVKHGDSNSRLLDKTFINQALIQWQDSLIDKLFDHFNGRSYWHESKYNQNEDYGIEADVREFNSTCTALGFDKLALDLNDEYIELHNEHIQLCLARKKELDEKRNSPETIAKREKAQARNAQLVLEKAGKAIELWRSGGPIGFEVRQVRPMILRVKDGIVETNAGASCTVIEARLLLRAVKGGKISDGFKVGSYTFNSVKDGMMKIGCHDILISELDSALADQTSLSLVTNQGVS